MIRAVREALHDVIAATVADEDFDIAVTVYDYVPVSPQLPAIIVGWPDVVDFRDQSLGGQRRADFVVVAMVGTSAPRAAQIVLDDLISKTIPDAVATYQTEAWLYAEPTQITNVRTDTEAQRIVADLRFSIYA